MISLTLLKNNFFIPCGLLRHVRHWWLANAICSYVLHIIISRYSASLITPPKSGLMRPRQRVSPSTPVAISCHYIGTTRCNNYNNLLTQLWLVHWHVDPGKSQHDDAGSVKVRPIFIVFCTGATRYYPVTYHWDTAGLQSERDLGCWREGITLLYQALFYDPGVGL